MNIGITTNLELEFSKLNKELALRVSQPSLVSLAQIPIFQCTPTGIDAKLVRPESQPSTSVWMSEEEAKDKFYPYSWISTNGRQHIRL